MPSYRRILVAFDGEDTGKTSLQQAIVIKKLHNSRIKVLTVLPEYYGDLDLTEVRDIRMVRP